MTEWIIDLIKISFGAIIGLFTSIVIVRKQMFYIACSEFRTQFIDEVLFLGKDVDPHSLSPTVDVIERARAKHEKALVKFLPYLSKNKTNQ